MAEGNVFGNIKGLVGRLVEFQRLWGPLNRKGYLCGECKSGYGPGPFIISCTNVCHFCQDTWHEIILYLVLEFIPITIFYLLILIF